MTVSYTFTVELTQARISWEEILPSVRYSLYWIGCRSDSGELSKVNCCGWYCTGWGWGEVWGNP